MKLSRWSRR